MKNFFINISIILITLLAPIQVGYAYDIDENVETAKSEGEDIYIGEDSDGIPVIDFSGDVTLDDATKYVNKKGSDLIAFIQNIAKPITLVVMVLTGLMGIIASLTGVRDGASKYAGAFLVAALAYAGVMLSPLILQLISGFVIPY